MSYFGDSSWDYVYDEIKEFLSEHDISELLEIVTAAIRLKEEGYLDD